jgi:hypothetical protein
MASPKPKAARHYSAAAQKAAALLKEEKKEPVVTDAQRTAIEAMVFEGKERKAAAKLAGITDEAMRQALHKPQVLAYLNECQEVLRVSLRPRALHTMGRLLTDKSGSVKFKAAEYLDGQNRGTHTVGGTTVINNNTLINNTLNVTPGYVIRLGRTAPQIEHLEAHGPKGLPDLADVPEEE